MKKTRLILLCFVMAASLTACVSNESDTSSETPSGNENGTETADNTENEEVLSIKEQGIFAAGGIVVTSEGTFDPINGQFEPTGQTHHADHASVLYQIPADNNEHPIVFLHGYGQSRAGWMTTPDGREGFSNIFLEKGYSTYLVDQPRRGDAGQTSVASEIPTTTQDQTWFTQFRIGLWPEFNDGVQFPQDEESLNQFFRQMTPDTGTFDAGVISDAMVEVFEKSGAGILVTHSQGGFPGWQTAIKSDKVEAIVAIEPGGFPFPETLDAEYGEVMGERISDEDFAKLIEKPIAVYFGDYIPEEASGVPAQDFWMGVRASAYQFAEIVNDLGGDCTIVDLPKEGISGNTHFMFQDLNNQEVADHMVNLIKNDCYVFYSFGILNLLIAV